MQLKNIVEKLYTYTDDNDDEKMTIKSDTATTGIDTAGVVADNNNDNNNNKKENLQGASTIVPPVNIDKKKLSVKILKCIHFILTK